jgi:hypothetical protein
VAAGELDGLFLEWEKFFADVVGNAEFLDAIAGILGEVPRHLEIHVVGRDEPFAGPAFLNDLDQLFGNI